MNNYLEDINDYLLEAVFNSPIRQSARFMALNRGINLKGQLSSMNPNASSTIKQANAKKFGKITADASRSPGSIGGGALGFGRKDNDFANRMQAGPQAALSSSFRKKAERQMGKSPATQVGMNKAGKGFADRGGTIRSDPKHMGIDRPNMTNQIGHKKPRVEATQYTPAYNSMLPMGPHKLTRIRAKTGLY